MRELFLHPVASEKNIARLYKRAFAEAVELYVLSAYLRTWDTTLKVNSRCAVFSFIIGKDFGITRKHACSAVLKWLPRQRKPFFLIADGISGFHPKALFWKTKAGTHHSLVGSSNLSDAGWNTNYESNVFTDLSVGEFKRVRTWIAEITKRSVPVSKKWLDGYQEAPQVRKSRTAGQANKSTSLSAIKLPTFRGQAAIIRKRRDMKKAFAKLRPVLLPAIRKCAAGKITNRQFFNILQAAWGVNEARIQGWGWQVTGRNSDFHRLCRSLVKIIDANKAARDLIVVQAIDDLKKNNVPTRRALLSELLCLFFPEEYPVLNKPVALYAKPYVKAPFGSTEGEKYLHLALSLRAALYASASYPAKDLHELDGLLWKYQYIKPQGSKK